MEYEVVVIGGGIGGLTTAALLAARGVNVCLFERQSQVGGCVANFEHSGYSFEPTSGLYSGWESEGIYHRIFSELPVSAPEAHRLSTAYVVRLPDQTEVSIAEEFGEFEANLRHAFPECSETAVTFYRKLRQLIESSGADFVHSNDAIAKYLTDTSLRFRSFIDVQLETFTQCASDRCESLRAAIILTAPHRGLWSIRGGAQTLADVLVQSLKMSGGSLRLNAPVLRVAFDQSGSPTGVDLLSGERVNATRAIISNLTIWDTYGKLIGLSRTPKNVVAALKRLRGRGAYLMFLAMDELAGSRLPSDHILSLSNWRQESNAEPESPIMFAAAPVGDSRPPAGKRAVTVSTFTDAEEWFSFHEDAAQHEAQDQAALERCWARLHSAMPELGDGIEVIETATPQTFYETTRRRFGMVGKPFGDLSDPLDCFATTIYPNVHLVGDTVSSGAGLEGVVESAWSVAELICPRV